VRSEILFGRIRPATMLVVRRCSSCIWCVFSVDTACARAGQMLLAAAPALVARSLTAAWHSRLRAIGATAMLVAFVIGVPTTMIDAQRTRRRRR
jgi:hypothetical protein